MSSQGSNVSSPARSRSSKRIRTDDDDMSVEKTPNKRGRKTQQTETPSRKSARGAAAVANGVSGARTRKCSGFLG